MLAAVPAAGTASDFGVGDWSTHEGGGFTENEGLASATRVSKRAAATAKIRFLKRRAKRRWLALFRVWPVESSLA